MVARERRVNRVVVGARRPDYCDRAEADAREPPGRGDVNKFSRAHRLASPDEQARESAEEECRRDRHRVVRLGR